MHRSHPLSGDPDTTSFAAGMPEWMIEPTHSQPVDPEYVENVKIPDDARGHFRTPSFPGLGLPGIGTRSWDTIQPTKLAAGCGLEEGFPNGSAGD